MSETDADFDVDAWREELLSYREQKDEAFATQRGSPLPPEEREEFEGLSYFDPNPDYRVEAEVEPIEAEEIITMETSTDGEVRYERVARLRFELKGEERTLVAYQQPDQPREEQGLFIPFRDKTTGQQTYPAGRYMEFEVGEAQSASESASGERSEPRAAGDIEEADTVTVDFNLAYFPFCAYSEAFECPLPPEENWLEVAVEAGEKFPDA